MRPKLFTMIKKQEFTKEKVIKDIVAGIIVAIIALPLSVALGISSGVSPEKGLITAVVAGFIISFVGGSRVQIGGPTGAFVIIVYGIIEDYGIDGLIMATIMAGVILVIFGLCRFGNIIKFVPHTITVGFTAGIAVTLLATQLKDFLGLQIDKVPAEFIPKIICYVKNISSINFTALVIGILSIIIILFWPKINKKIPGSLVAIIITTLIVQLMGLDVETIGSKFPTLSGAIPMPSLPNMDLKTIEGLIQPAFTIAILAAMESLLSAVVADGMIGGNHNSNMELIGQGLGNIASGLFGGIPATGAIARTAANVKNGGRSPIAGMVHAVVLLLTMIMFMPLAKMIPMTTLGAILIVVSYNMGEWKTFASLLKAPKSEVTVLLLTFFLTVVLDLVVAIEVGMVLAMILFVRRVAENTEIKSTILGAEGDDEEVSDKSKGNVLVYEINGPFFFGVTHKFIDIMKRLNSSYDVLVLDMKHATTVDATAIDALERLYKRCEKNNIKLCLANIKEQPKKVLTNMGFIDLVGEEAVFKSRDKAIEGAVPNVAI
ncbi:STAS domain-containing protein [Clostridium bornimense]|uniref:SulP family inorganic anion transporter n=1 Tax=Clostridium bornimense TaxID=1216932 RepID=UPI001C100236|nr:SulP family inorganic anion transporter [Clostridium bornimense]MBU5316028.1 STAS domain-containing protein [Clostridium bornimense]